MNKDKKYYETHKTEILAKLKERYREKGYDKEARRAKYIKNNEISRYQNKISKDQIFKKEFIRLKKISIKIFR